MDDFLKKNDVSLTGQAPPTEVKKIEFKHIKERKCMRTYILNLDQFVPDEKVREDLMTKLKKALGTACIGHETEFGFGYGFNGDFTVKIKAYLINNKIVTKDAFR